jgi:hypothetical protein
MKYVGLALGLPLLMMMAGCSTPAFVSGYYFTPRPALAELPATQPSQPPAVAAFATIIGIRNPDESQHLPLAVEARLRLDNNSDETVTFDARSMDLNSADLMRFDPPAANASGPVVLGPRESAVITVDFPFPPGRSYDTTDMSTLQLRWAVQVGSATAGQVVNFSREAPPPSYNYYYGPYWGVYAPYPYFGGVVVIRHRW